MATKPTSRTLPTTIPLKARGDMKSLRDELLGPIKVHLDSGRHYTQEDLENDDLEKPEGVEIGELIVEPFINSEGKQDWRPEQDPEPFLEDVWIRKNTSNAHSQIKLKAIREQLENEPLRLAAAQIEFYVAKWDLTDGGQPVPITEEELTKREAPGDLLFSVLNAVFAYNRPPKALSGRLQNTSSQEE